MPGGERTDMTIKRSRHHATRLHSHNVVNLVSIRSERAESCNVGSRATAARRTAVTRTYITVLCLSRYEYNLCRFLNSIVCNRRK